MPAFSQRRTTCCISRAGCAPILLGRKARLTVGRKVYCGVVVDYERPPSPPLTGPWLWTPRWLAIACHDGKRREWRAVDFRGNGRL